MEKKIFIVILFFFFCNSSKGRKLEKLSDVKDVLQQAASILDEVKKEVLEGYFGVKADSCTDLRPDKCAGWKEEERSEWSGKCLRSKYLQDHCMQSCGICVTEIGGGSSGGSSGGSGGSQENCKDNFPNCQNILEKEEANSDWREKCSEKQFFINECKKTCELCDGESGGSGGTGGNGGTGGSGGTGGNGGTGGTGGTGGSSGSSGTLGNNPVECTEENRGGNCECGDKSKGFTTYVFESSGVTRCFTIYRPTKRTFERLPIVLSSNCYAANKLQGMEMTSEDTDGNKAAARYGYVRVGLSTPDVHWTFGNDGVVNSAHPMPCSEKDSKDIAYVKTVLDFLDSHSTEYDSSRIWTEGFSQNSMFSAYIGFCFADKVIGIWQGGSGMALTGKLPNLPGCQAQCKASAFAESSSCNQCREDHLCSECEYWPIYPCYNQQRPMIDCLADYVNDYIASDRTDSGTLSTSKYMYEKLKNERHDARLLRFDESDTIPGGHKNPANTAYWQVGCLGITAPCSYECEQSFTSCTNREGGGSDAFKTCIEEDRFEALAGCSIECAPTLVMLEQSEKPVELALSMDTFGQQDNSAAVEPRPSTSICTMSDK